MLAPSYRRTSRRQRGISLSKISSLQKDRLNKSFQCIEPSIYNMLPNSYFNSTIKKSKEEKQNYKTVGKIKTESNYEKIKSQGQDKKQIQMPSPRHYHNKSLLLPKAFNQNINQSISRSLYQETQSINQMIQLLVEYEKNCQKNMDLTSAEEAKRKINQLRKEEISTRRKELQVEEKQYVIKTRRSGVDEQKEFHQFWSEKLVEAKQALREIQEKHIEEQQKELQIFEQNTKLQLYSKVKYSSKVLQIRRNLTQLIKSRKYKEAQLLKSILQKKQIEEEQKWKRQCEQKKENRIKEFKKKQAQELQAFKLKLNSSLNQLIKEKEKQEERMINKMKKMQVEAMKMPSSIIRAKKNLQNESKAKIQKYHY